MKVRALLARARKPVDLDAMDMPQFLYDGQEDVFLDEHGKARTAFRKEQSMQLFFDGKGGCPGWRSVFS